MACAVRLNGYSTSPNPPRPTGCGCRASLTCHWPTAPGPTCAPFRIWGTKHGSAARRTRDHGLAASFSPSRPPRDYSSTQTAVVPGRAGSTAATPTAPCSISTVPCARRAAAATATITRKPKVSGPASKRRYSNCVSGLFLPTWPTPRPASPTILTTTIMSACTPASVTSLHITLINNYLKILP